MTPKGTSNSLLMVGEGMNALSRIVFPELCCVKLLPCNGTVLLSVPVPGADGAPVSVQHGHV